MVGKCSSTESLSPISVYTVQISRRGIRGFSKCDLTSLENKIHFQKYYYFFPMANLKYKVNKLVIWSKFLTIIAKSTD